MTSADHIRPDPAAVDSELAAKQAELEAQISELTAPLADSGTIGFGKRVGEGTTQAIQRMTDVSTVENLQAVLAAVVRSREKITEGTYGACDVCGADIPAGRLEARPWSTTCVQHA